MDRQSDKKRPLHPCPICGNGGRQTSGYNDTAYFRCDSCEQAFSERLLPGGRVEVAFRARLIRASETSQEAAESTPESANSMYLAAG